MKKLLSMSNPMLFLGMVSVVLFWWVAKNFNLYRIAFIGVVYELLALPIMAITLVLVLLAIWNLFRAKGKSIIWSLLSLLLFGLAAWQIIYR